MDYLMKILEENMGYVVAAVLVLLMALIVITIVLLIKYRKMKQGYDSFMEGRNGESLEELLKTVMEDNRKVKAQSRNNIDAIVGMKKNQKSSFRKIGILKYDTFRGMAGKLSFSLALLNEEDSGFVLSCMHTQDGCYSYLKEIIHGESHAILSNEEKDALEMALTSNTDQVEIPIKREEP